MKVDIVISDDKEKAAIIFDKEAFPYVGAFLNHGMFNANHTLWSHLLKMNSTTSEYDLPEDFNYTLSEIIGAMLDIKRG